MTVREEPSQISLKVVLRALSSRNYRLFFGGQSISLTGTWMQNVAMSWMVYRLTNSAFMLGAVGFAADIFALILMPFAGVIADRYDRRRIIIITQTLALIQALVLATLVLTHTILISHIFILAMLLGIITAFDLPARQAFVVQMIEKKEDLPNAIALNSLVFNGARLIGPSVAGLLIAVAGEGGCFLLNGLSYFAVLAALLAMRIEKRPERLECKSHLYEFKEGFAHAFGSAPIRNIILMVAIMSLMGTSYAVLMPVLVREVLNKGPDTLGFLVGAAGSGALIAAVALAVRQTTTGLCRNIPFAAALGGASLIALSFSHTLHFSLPIMVVIGFCFMTQMASSNTIIQTVVDDNKRGRVMSLFAMAFRGVAPFGSLLAGWLATQIGVLHTLIIGGVSLVISAWWFWRKLPNLKVTQALVDTARPTEPVLPG